MPGPGRAGSGARARYEQGGGAGAGGGGRCRCSGGEGGRAGGTSEKRRGRALVALVALRRAVNSCALSLSARELVRRFPPVSSFDDHDKERRARESRSKGSSACFLGDEGALSRRCSLDSTLFALSTLRSVQRMIPCESESASSSVAVRARRARSSFLALFPSPQLARGGPCSRASSESVVRQAQARERERAARTSLRKERRSARTRQEARAHRTRARREPALRRRALTCTRAGLVRWRTLSATCTLAVR